MTIAASIHCLSHSTCNKFDSRISSQPPYIPHKNLANRMTGPSHEPVAMMHVFEEVPSSICLPIIITQNAINVTYLRHLIHQHIDDHPYSIASPLVRHLTYPPG